MKAQIGVGLILVVDRQRNMRHAVAQYLRDAGYHTITAKTGEEACEVLATEAVDVLLTATQIQPIDGFELISLARQSSPDTSVILMTASENLFGEVLHLGVLDRLRKPFSVEELTLLVARVMEHRRLLGQAAARARENRVRHPLCEIVGNSAAVRELVQRAAELAASETHVLLSGERGTGKEFVARALHAHSQRAGAALERVVCMDHEWFEPTLFGSLSPGVHSGKTQRGLLGDVQGGSLLLSEVAAASRSTLDKLRGVIESGGFRRLGDDRVWRADVRMFATTTEPHPPHTLRGCSNLHVIHLPPLRERREDIPSWVDVFVQRLSAQKGITIRLGDAAMDALVQLPYPGNLDELWTTLEHSAHFAAGGVIDLGAIRASQRAQSA